MHPDDGRIHASFNQSVAATGRLSSSDPNLQNIPVRTEDGRQIRQAFIAGRPDWRLLTADYSQIELRILAHYSDDPALCRAFAHDLDIHKAVAARIFQVDEAAVDDSMRRVAKTVNFGVVYGLSAYGLSSRLGITQTEAAAFIEAYFQEYAGVDRFITQVLEGAQAERSRRDDLGRRRPINGIKSTTGRSRNLAERTAINTVIQGSAADLIKRAMILLDQRLREQGFKARMLLQIHDELVFEAPAAEMPRLAGLVGRVMTSALDLKVPLKVDIAAGHNWLDVEPIDPGGRELNNRGCYQPNDRHSEPLHAAGAFAGFFCTGIAGDPLHDGSPYAYKNVVTIDTDPLHGEITLHHASPPLPRFLRCFEKPRMSDDGCNTFRKPTWFNHFSTFA